MAIFFQRYWLRTLLLILVVLAGIGAGAIQLQHYQRAKADSAGQVFHVDVGTDVFTFTSITLPVSSGIPTDQTDNLGSWNVSENHNGTITNGMFGGSLAVDQIGINSDGSPEVNVQGSITGTGMMSNLAIPVVTSSQPVKDYATNSAYKADMAQNYTEDTSLTQPETIGNAAYEALNSPTATDSDSFGATPTGVTELGPTTSPASVAVDDGVVGEIVAYNSLSGLGSSTASSQPPAREGASNRTLSLLSPSLPAQAIIYQAFGGATAFAVARGLVNNYCTNGNRCAGIPASTWAQISAGMTIIQGLLIGTIGAILGVQAMLVGSPILCFLASVALVQGVILISAGMTSGTSLTSGQLSSVDTSLTDNVYNPSRTVKITP